MSKLELYVIAGPTASGKTGAAIALAKEIGGEVVSCDSMQIYQGMDILSAKPTLQEQDGVVHHLLSVLPPSEKCSAARFRDMAIPIIEDIARRGKQPILCGGTGLYIDAVTKPMGFALEGDDNLRATLMQENPLVLHERLAAIDPPTAARLHPNDVRRVVRALEVHALTGKTMTQIAEEDAKKEAPYAVKMFALDWQRDVLYNRIDRRVDIMLECGLIEEVSALMKDDAEHPTALQALGYKEILSALRGEISMEQAIDQVKQGSRNYAKRQLTWFRRDARIQWLEAEKRTAQQLVSAMLAYH
ncbi:MAG: tRNA (adenosine(37)-N6)-dimethylallyltransferase MiaA [Clostridiales bacterium]|nr:tRNA (adenosine(37)-N6)-dimethylallyltransferase MiaA [Clostridiales bacterium]